MKYTNLRSKTVFDFCKDTAVLKEITECSGKAEYLEKVKDNPVERARSYMDLAERTKDKSLEKAVAHEFKKELQTYDATFNE